MIAASNDLPDDKDVLKAALLEARARLSGAEAMIAHLQLVIAKMKREMFGPRSERSQRLIDQMELQLEELAVGLGEDAAKLEAASVEVRGFTRHKATRRDFPDHLPRRRIVHPMPASCPCCGGTRLSKIGEDVTETLDVVPRQWFVTEHVREKFSCRSCETITQPPAPFHVIARGFAGPSLLAMILVEKYANHQPLNRQSEQYAREGIELSVSTMADHVGACAAALMPLYELIKAHVFAAERIHGDDTTVPVLAKSLPPRRRGSSAEPGACGPMCAMISRLAVPLRRLPCSSTRPIAVASTPSGISPDMPGFCRLMRMRGSTRSTSRSESLARSRKRRAGRTQDASSSNSPTSPRRRAARRRL